MCNTHLRKHPLVHPVHFEHLLRNHGRRLDASLQYDGYKRVGSQPCMSCSVYSLYTNIFQHRAANSFLISLFSFKYLQTINDCCSDCEYPLWSFFTGSKLSNVGQPYRLCLQIEWQPTRQRMLVGVLGSPEKNFVDSRHVDLFSVNGKVLISK